MKIWIKKTLLTLLLLLVVLFITLAIVLTNMDPDASYDKKHAITTDRTVTIVLIDGLSKEIFEQYINEGRLPQFKKLIDESIYVRNGIGAFPTMTGFAYYPFITGMKAPDSGIFGLRWFNRNLDYGNLRNYVGRTNIQMNNDISSQFKNLFELNEEYYTASINTYMNKGVHHSLKTGWAHTTAKYSKASLFPFLRVVPFIGRNISKDHFEHESLVTDLAIDQLKFNPKVQWITYPSLDAHNHVHGTDDIYYDLLQHLDGELNRLDQAIAALDQKDRMVVVVSDHGILDVEVNVDVPAIIEKELGLKIERGLSTHLGTDQLKDPLSEFVRDDGYFVINGNLSAYIYMKDPEIEGAEAWRSPTEGKTLSHYPSKNGRVDLPTFVASIEGVELTTYNLSQDTLVVLHGTDRAFITSDSIDYYSYHPLVGDPLLFGDILIPGISYHKDSLLIMTADMDFPYSLVRLWELMQEENAPDIVLTTKAGYDIARNYEIFVENYKGGHGGIHKDLLSVPYIMKIPEIQGKMIHVARAEDIGATIFDYLQLNTTYSLTGRSLLE